MVNDVADWPLSSYRATVAQAPPLECLQVAWLLRQFGLNREQAIERYRNFVRAGVGLPPVWEGLRNQIFLGDKSFVEKVQRRSLGRPLSDYVETIPDMKEGIRKAYESGDYTMQQIANAFGVHYSTVSRSVKKIDFRNA